MMPNRDENRVLTFRGVDKAAVLYGIGKTARALACVNRILAQKPGNKDALLVKAEILSDLDRPRAALKLVEGVLKRNPSDFAALSTKGGVLIQAGEPRRALRIFATLGKRPRVPKEERLYLYWSWIDTLITLNRRRRAKQILEQALKLFPEDDLLLHFKTLASGKARNGKPPTRAKRTRKR